VLALHAEADGTLWIGTSTTDSAVCEREVCHDQPRAGLLASIISQIVDDGAGNLWMGSHHGILRASKAELNRCADGELKSVRCLSYGKAEGLASQKCSGGFQPASARPPTGGCGFPRRRTRDPRSGNFTTNTVPPPVVIEELIVEGQPVKFQGPRLADGAAEPAPVLQIPPGKQRFELRYTALSFVAPDKVASSTSWRLGERLVEAGTRRVAQYSYLPPGPTISGGACNNDEVWNEQGPPWPSGSSPRVADLVVQNCPGGRRRRGRCGPGHIGDANAGAPEVGAFGAAARARARARAHRARHP